EIVAEDDTSPAKLTEERKVEMTEFKEDAEIVKNLEQNEIFELEVGKVEEKLAGVVGSGEEVTVMDKEDEKLDTVETKKRKPKKTEITKSKKEKEAF
ncbi:hypothetical protein WUBG_19315, partial [Wuchereria bancrofti]